MQARLPSGEVVSIGQLASLAQRPVTSAGGSKPLTFQIQGNKLTLTGAQSCGVLYSLSPCVVFTSHLCPYYTSCPCLCPTNYSHHSPLACFRLRSSPADRCDPSTSCCLSSLWTTFGISWGFSVGVSLGSRFGYYSSSVPTSDIWSLSVVGYHLFTCSRIELSCGPSMLTCPGASFGSDQSVPNITKFSSSSGFPSGSSTFYISGFSHLSGSYGGFTDNNPGPFSNSSSGSASCSGCITDSASSYDTTINVRSPFTLINIGIRSNFCVGSLINSNSGINPSFITSLKPGFYSDIDPSPNFSTHSWWIVSVSDTFFGNREPSRALSNSDIVIDSSIIPGTNTSPDTIFSTRRTTSGAASLPVTMVNRLPVPKDEPETLTLRSGPPSPLPTATSFSGPRPRRQPPPPPRSPFYLDSLEEKRKQQRSERLERIFQLSEAHGALAPVYGTEVLDFCTLPQPVASPIGPRSPGPSHPIFWTYTEAAHQAVLFPQQRLDQLSEIIERFIFVMPPVEAPPPSLHACHPPPWLAPHQAAFQEQLACELWPRARPLHRIVCNMRTQFPDLRLIQYDCGKLQTLAVLLRQLKAEGHRVLIFTQMTRMLDVLEQFLTYHGHLYLRLDGSTRVEQRQALMERFNADKRIFCFILSTRSGGVGVNLTGADTVVFYDSDWNPTMDAQAQDRCHRIGQTRDVHIYRLISERTVEENILKKANQKRMLGDMAIEGGNFTTAYFKQQTIRELFDMPLEEPPGSSVSSVPEEEEETVASKQTHILEQALCRAEDEEDIRAATQAKAEQVAELAEFNENEGFPAGEGEEASRPGPGAEDEEMSRAEQEIAALVEQLTPIERYAMKFLEASLEEVSREELKQAEEQVEAARKDLDQAKEEVFRLPQEEEEGPGAGDEMSCATSGVSHRRSKKVKAPERLGTRVSERLRGARAETQGANHTPVTSSHQTCNTFVPPRCSPDLLPVAVDVLPESEKNLPLIPAPSSTLEAESIPDDQEQEVPGSVEGTNRTLLPGGGELTVSLSESNGLELPPSAASDEPLQLLETHRNLEDTREVQTPVSNSEKPQELVRAEVTAPSTSSSATSSPEGPLPARPPRRRTSADVEIRGQGSGRTGQPPGPKVLRKLPGRLVTVVEEKELVKRRRHRATASTLVPGVSEVSASPRSPSIHSMSGPESSPPSSGPCEAAPTSSLSTPTQHTFIACRHNELGITGGGSPENGEGAKLAITPPAVKRRRGRPPKKNRSPADAGRGVDEAPSSISKGKTNGVDPIPGPETVTATAAEPDLKPQPLAPQPVHKPEPIILSPVEKRRRGRPPKARDLPIPGTISSPGDGNLESRTQPLPFPATLTPLLACPTAVANTVTTVTISTSPPKRKRGRPPKNPPSPRPSQHPVLDPDSSSVLESCGLGVQRQPLGQAESEGSSSDEDGSRPLTRLARLRLEAEGMRGRKSEGSMVMAVIQDDLDLADSGPSGLELTPPVVSLTPKFRSTRLRPGSLVPPLETEKMPRKRSGAPVGSSGMAKRGRLQPPSPLGPEGSVEESEAEASGDEEEGDGTPRRRTGPRRLVGTTNQGDQRILRSSAPPHLSIPTISHRGRKAKT
ncbi:rCG39385, isoform CRA_a [Rattus norvegicus]|uniref:RCG39385, isoform CRA_a n=1 Tax=Rattus norvegicus TaxID=10116 RepID=A6I9Q8_RAT|nr:rCG39385, isoform CRA_a [Rattus norvegicus]